MTEHDGTTGPGDWGQGQQQPPGPPPAGNAPRTNPPGQPAPSWDDTVRYPPQQPGQQYPGAPQYPGQQYPTTPYPTQQYPGQQYPGAGDPNQQYQAGQYPGQQYPGQQYPTTPYPTQQYPGQQYPGAGGPNQPDWLSGSVAEPRRHRRRLTLAVAASVVAVLGVAGGAYAVLGNHDTSPDHYVPADAIAVVSVDLDSGSTQNVAAARFLGSFPSLTKNGKPNNLIDSLLRSTALSASDRRDFARDIQPWLGPHVAIAADPQGGKVRPLIVAQVTDQDKARAGLSDLAAKSTDVGFAFRDSYAIISETSGAASQAATDSAKTSIADDTDYQHDTGALDGDRIATGWVDLARAKPYADIGSTRVPGLANLRGRAALAVRFAADHAELEARVFGSSAQPGGVVGPDVTALPNDTAVAVGVSGLDKVVSQAMSALDQAGLTGPLNALSAQTGLRFPDDIVALFGDRAVLAANGDLSGIGLVTSADPDAAKQAADKLLTAIGDPNDVVTKQAGDHLVLASTPDYAGQLASGGHLGDQPLFRTAVPDAADASVLLYVNLPKVLSASGQQVPPDARPVYAVGLTASGNGDSATVRIRVVVG
ncbi:MAG TPA: DUF3352 domain-containing protein [Mycobacteriales bacterium]|nr:DUF3352 domain-containing protein [Mycobacteriales bacterium]